MESPCGQEVANVENRNPSMRETTRKHFPSPPPSFAFFVWPTRTSTGKMGAGSAGAAYQASRELTKRSSDGYEITGISSLFGGIQWNKSDGDKKISRTVVSFLEDRRVLFGARHREDEIHCARSVLEIRHFLTQQISQAKPAKELESALRRMRGACRKFLDAAAHDGSNFWHHPGYGHDPFFLTLGELRASVGYDLMRILDVYPQPVGRQLAAILPLAVDRRAEVEWTP